MSAPVAMGDLFDLPQTWQAFAEQVEPLELDFTTHQGHVVALRGTATIQPARKRIAVRADGPVWRAGLCGSKVADVLRCAVRDRLIGSQDLRAAVGMDYQIGVEQ